MKFCFVRQIYIVVLLVLPILPIQAMEEGYVDKSSEREHHAATKIQRAWRGAEERDLEKRSFLVNLYSTLVERRRKLEGITVGTRYKPPVGIKLCAPSDGIWLFGSILKLSKNLENICKVSEIGDPLFCSRALPLTDVKAALAELSSTDSVAEAYKLVDFIIRLRANCVADIDAQLRRVQTRIGWIEGWLKKHAEQELGQLSQATEMLEKWLNLSPVEFSAQIQENANVIGRLLPKQEVYDLWVSFRRIKENVLTQLMSLGILPQKAAKKSLARADELRKWVEQHGSSPHEMCRSIGLSSGIRELIPLLGQMEQDEKMRVTHALSAICGYYLQATDFFRISLNSRIAWLRGVIATSQAGRVLVPPSNEEFIRGPFNPSRSVGLVSHDTLLSNTILSGDGRVVGETLVYYPRVACQIGPSCSWNAVDYVLALDRAGHTLLSSIGSRIKFPVLQLLRKDRQLSSVGLSGYGRNYFIAQRTMIADAIGQMIMKEMRQLESDALDSCSYVATRMPRMPIVSRHEQKVVQAEKKPPKHTVQFGPPCLIKSSIWKMLAPMSIGQHHTKAILADYDHSTGLHYPVVMLWQEKFGSRKFSLTDMLLPGTDKMVLLYEMLDQMREGVWPQINFKINLSMRSNSRHAVAASLIKLPGMDRPFIVWVNSNNSPVSLSEYQAALAGEYDDRSDIVLLILDRLAEYVATGRLPLCGYNVRCCIPYEEGYGE